jgi:hypothetical protein
MKNLIKKFLKFTQLFLSKVVPNKVFMTKEKNIFELYCDEEKIKCFNHFKKYFKTSLFLESKGTREYAVKNAVRNDPNQEFTYIEFGVYKGTSVNDLSKYVKKIYAFDSFEGLKEDMLGNTEAIGTFNLNKQIPNLNKNVVPVVGWIQDTLDNFLEKENPKINFVHIDVDTYETSKFILKKVKKFLVPNATILFDELYNFPGWDVGEYKALSEEFNENDYKFKVFSIQDQKVVVTID